MIMKTLTAMKLTKTDNVPSLVDDRVYIGGVGCAFNFDTIQEHGITHILTVASKINPRFNKKGIIYKIIECLDSPDADVKQHFEESNEYISKVLSENADNKILIHCFAGKSRAASFSLAYLIGVKKIPLAKAYEDLKRKRPIVQPNAGFFAQLRIYEKQTLGTESSMSDLAVKGVELTIIKELAEKRQEEKEDEKKSEIEIEA